VISIAPLQNTEAVATGAKFETAVSFRYNAAMVRWFLVALIVVCLPAGNGMSADARRVDFAREVRPILERSCWKCHGPQKQQGGLRLDRREEVLSAGDSGTRAVIPRNVAESELIRRIEAPDASERMPSNSAPLSPEQIGILRAWIEQGAAWPEAPTASPASHGEMVVTDEDRQHWSYRALHTIELPTVQNADWCRTAIDRFILAALESQRIHANPTADRRTLIRRVYFDVIGLPPSPAEVEAFVADNSPRAYEQLVDRLLSSIHYGERWGRHWLDLARYADSDGLETDADRPNAFHYRDFIIRALNEDLSYQTFVRWQLAGDEYDPDNPLALAATGFLTGAPCEKLTDQHLEEERLRLRFNELDDMAVTTAAAFLGLTLGCARCHDHKFDAIPTRDYYRIQCAFTTTSRDNILLATRADAAAYREADRRWSERLNAAQSKLNSWLAEQQKPHAAALTNKKIDSLPITAEQKTQLKKQPHSEAAKKLAKRHQKALQLSDEDYRQVFSDELRKTWDGMKRAVDAVQRKKPKSPPMALAITDIKAEPQPTWLLERGDFYARKEPLQLGFLSVMTRQRSSADYLTDARHDAPSDRSTLQRRALADWMTDSENGAGALLARTIVNRVWQHHFGEGLVRTVSDFGVRGEHPSHPELLEWLAGNFIRGGWQLKPLHRLILTSSVYLQTTAFDEGRSQRDPDNRFLWRRRPLRLEAEIIRDAVLAVSGTLNFEQFGPAFKPPIPADAIVARNTKSPYPQDARDTVATRRRTVYMFHKRVTQHPFMQVFDEPDASVSCGRRNTTTVAPQALALLNDTFLRDLAIDLARRLLAEGTTPEEWMTEGFLLALGRPPTEAERMYSLEFLATQPERRAARDAALSAEDVRLQSLADYCQTIFSLNEFIYVD
jgi:hypothetical protein